jgi:hypothetical protein
MQLDRSLRSRRTRWPDLPEMLRGDIQRGVQHRRGLEIGPGANRVALVAPSHPAVVVGHGQRRIEPDRLVIVGDGAIGIAFQIPGVAALEEIVRLRLQADRRIEVGDGAIIGTVAGL